MIEQMAQELPEDGAPMQGGKLSKDELMDVKIAYGMMRNLIAAPQGRAVVLDSLSAKDPVPSMSIILANMVDKIAKTMEKKGLGLSPRVWLAKNGAVDRAFDEVAKVAKTKGIEFGEDLQQAVFLGVIDQIKLAAEADANGERPEGEEGGPPPVEEGMGPPPVEAGGPPPPGGEEMGPPPPVDPSMMGEV